MPSRSLFYGKIVQGESRTKQTFLFFMPSRRLPYTKVLQLGHITRMSLFYGNVVKYLHF